MRTITYDRPVSSASAKHPWKIPPRPLNGDATDEFTFASVGRSLSAWAALEDVITHIFVALIGFDDEEAAKRAYDAVTSQQDRFEMICGAAKVFLPRGRTHCWKSGSLLPWNLYVSFVFGGTKLRKGLFFCNSSKIP